VLIFLSPTASVFAGAGVIVRGGVFLILQDVVLIAYLFFSGSSGVEIPGPGG